jgi:hypothetical protein
MVDEVRYRWERLELREKINAVDPRIILGITAGSFFILLVAITILLWPRNNTPVVKEYKKAWFYDLNTGQLFIDKASKIPPIESPSGPMPDGSKAGVKAYVYSYVTEPTEADRVVGFLWKQDPQSSTPYDDSAKQWQTGKLVKKTQGKDWVSADSTKGKEILSEVSKKNKEGIYPHYCIPK